MRNTKIKAMLLAIMLSLVCLFGSAMSCAPDEQSPEVSLPFSDDRIQIGISFDTFVVERWMRDRDVFVSHAQELGAQVNVQNANGSIEKQISQIEYFIEKGVDVIVIVAIDGTRLLTVIERAQNEGIFIIAYDRLILEADVDLYISFDNEQVGRLMAQALVENMPDGGDVFAIYGPTSDYNAILVKNGFLEVIDQSDLRLTYQKHCDAWVSERAYEAVTEWLGLAGRVDGVMCGNDDLASQAFRALAENRLADHVILVGQDADLAACQRVVEGTQAMTVYKPVDDLAKEAATYAVMLADKRPLDIDGRIFDGKQDVPYRSLAPVAVTKNNIDEIIIEGGFHLREDVYRNVKP